MSIHLIVVGAGLAGLAAAISTKIANPSHRVTILESVADLAEVGAGLQLTPNATRLFKNWGVYDELTKKATFPSTLSVVRYDGAKILSHTPDFQDQVQARYKAPFWGMHRVDLQSALVRRCKELDIPIRLNSKVTSVDFASTTVSLKDGETFSGDVLLCSEGLWSATRSQFLGHPAVPILTGDLAYRIVINIDDLHGAATQKLRDFIAAKGVTFWVGPTSHVVAYTMRDAKLFNIVLLCPDNLPESVRKMDGDVGEMQGLFEDWDPILQAFLSEVKSVAKWKLFHLEPLESWSNEAGTFYMAGDACHPMLPYLAQGANSSLEDGAVLGGLLGKVNKEGPQGKEQLKRVKALYEELRKGRGERIAGETWKQREEFHLADGDEQVKRDQEYERKGAEASRWTDWEGNAGWLYGYDAYKEVAKAFEAAPF